MADLTGAESASQHANERDREDESPRGREASGEPIDDGVDFEKKPANFPRLCLNTISVLGDQPLPRAGPFPRKELVNVFPADRARCLLRHVGPVPEDRHM